METSGGNAGDRDKCHDMKDLIYQTKAFGL